jgi:hypothetical protein
MYIFDPIGEYGSSSFFQISFPQNGIVHPNYDSSFINQNIVIDHQYNFLYVYENNTIIQIDFEKFLPSNF